MKIDKARKSKVYDATDNRCYQNDLCKLRLLGKGLRRKILTKSFLININSISRPNYNKIQSS